MNLKYKFTKRLYVSNKEIKNYIIRLECEKFMQTKNNEYIFFSPKVLCSQIIEELSAIPAKDIIKKYYAAHETEILDHFSYKLGNPWYRNITTRLYILRSSTTYADDTILSTDTKHLDTYISGKKLAKSMFLEEVNIARNKHDSLEDSKVLVNKSIELIRILFRTKEFTVNRVNLYYREENTENTAEKKV